MAKNDGITTTWDIGVTIARNNAVPLDSTENQASLSEAQEYAKNGATSYVGQVIKVVDTNDNVSGCYVIKNKQGDLLELATADKLDSLAKAFTFKGVASAIDEDRCTITVGSATIKDGDDTHYTIQQKAYDILKETMYGWGTADGSGNVYWTHESTGEELSPVYTKGDKTDVECLIYQDDVYYFNSTNVYENLDGDFLYKNGEKYYLDSTHNQEASGVTTNTYHGYKFIKIADTVLTLNTPESYGISASPDNIGWVYQIGEEEYASNGSIWVQLGSPKEDWIVIK